MCAAHNDTVTLANARRAAQKYRIQRKEHANAAADNLPLPFEQILHTTRKIHESTSKTRLT